VLLSKNRKIQSIKLMKNSIHLKNFPDVSFLKDEKDLVAAMDMVRDVCSSALFIRDQRNLRVRLPLNKLTIIGKKAAAMLEYKDIIADEVNVKNVEILEEIGNLAEIKLQVNLKKVGAKLGSKLKEINLAIKENNWQKIADNKVEIAGEILVDDEFEIKLITKNSNNIVALPSNDCLVELDIVVTEELEEEGLARDLVRVIQQNRKDANLDISNHIKIVINGDEKISEVVKKYQNYIAEQTLSDEVLIGENADYEHSFVNKIDDVEVIIKIKVV
jgi:isoleucyl-tRNA synthetase